VHDVLRDTIIEPNRPPLKPLSFEVLDLQFFNHIRLTFPFVMICEFQARRFYVPPENLTREISRNAFPSVFLTGRAVVAKLDPRTPWGQYPPATKKLLS